MSTIEHQIIPLHHFFFCVSWNDCTKMDIGDSPLSSWEMNDKDGDSVPRSVNDWTPNRLIDLRPVHQPPSSPVVFACSTSPAVGLYTILIVSDSISIIKMIPVLVSK